MRIRKASAVPIQGLFHININCRDFERSLAFYKMLGFRAVLDLPRHKLSPELAAGLRIPEGEARGALLMVGEDPRATRIDLIEWIQPKTEGTPPHLYHTGMPRLALRTKDLPAMYEDLKAKGVKFLSEPQEINLAGGERFVCLEDPDGTVIELLEIL